MLRMFYADVKMPMWELFRVLNWYVTENQRSALSSFFPLLEPGRTRHAAGVGFAQIHIRTDTQCTAGVRTKGNWLFTVHSCATWRSSISPRIRRLY